MNAHASEWRHLHPRKVRTSSKPPGLLARKPKATRSTSMQEAPALKYQARTGRNSGIMHPPQPRLLPAHVGLEGQRRFKTVQMVRGLPQACKSRITSGKRTRDVLRVSIPEEHSTQVITPERPSSFLPQVGNNPTRAATASGHTPDAAATLANHERVRKDTNHAH